MDYESYLNLDELLDTTKPVSDAPLETMFIVAHQSSELRFKVLIQELTCLIDTPEIDCSKITTIKLPHNAIYNPIVQLQRVKKV